MLFNSIHFAVFLPIVLLIYFACPHRFRWAWLLLASYYFYMCWEPRYAILIALSTLITYGTAWAMNASSGWQKRFYLIFSLVSNLGVLFYFKYCNFFLDSLSALIESLGIHAPLPIVHVMLPVGISFYTFQALSYSVDSYRGKIAPERHLGIYALYVSYFPQLVAGPIERSTHLLNQFKIRHRFDYEGMRAGLLIMTWGLFKKVVVADRVAPLVNLVYGDVESFSGVFYWIATGLFAVQIYCDFSGYSDMAIGVARLMGIDLMTNFRQPYFSKSIGEFWSRWHISLSTWFRDYLYIPLGGSRCKKWRWYTNIMIVFVVSGLWHGANWTYIVWGALNGLYLLAEAICGIQKQDRDRAPWIIRMAWMLLTFVLINLAWVFFRADSLADGFYILTHLFDGVGSSLSELGVGGLARSCVKKLGIGRVDRYIILVALLVLWLVDSFLNTKRSKDKFFRLPAWVRWVVYYGLILGILFFGAFNTSQQFIYFQF